MFVVCELGGARHVHAREFFRAVGVCVGVCGADKQEGPSDNTAATGSCSAGDNKAFIEQR